MKCIPRIVTVKKKYPQRSFAFQWTGQEEEINMIKKMKDCTRIFLEQCSIMPKIIVEMNRQEFLLNIGDWLVYDVEAYEYRRYTDKEFNKLFDVTEGDSA